MKERFFALDFLRASMMFLGVLFHSLILGPKLSFLNDEWNARVLALIMENSHTFRMPLFFCLSGFLSSMLVNKLGSRQFLVNRLHRLLLPFLLSLITIGFITNQFGRALIFLQDGHDGITVFRMIISFYDFGLHNFGPSHLWFLYYLILFIPAILSVQYLIVLLPSRFSEIRHRRFGFLKSRLLFITILTVFPTIVLLITGSNGNPTPGFAVTLSAFLPYFYYFGFGWYLHRCRFNLEYFVPNFRWLILAGFILATARLVVWSSFGWNYALAIILLYNYSLWFYIFGFLGLAKRYFDKPSPYLGFFSDASYWIYLIHYPIVLFIKLFFFKGMQMFTYIFFLCVIVFLCVVSYNYIIRPTVIGKLLNGKILPSYPLHKIQLFTKPVIRIKRISQLQYYRYVSRNYRFSRSKDIQRL